MQNYMLTLCYDGSRYKGWQRQGNTEGTIQAKLETILSRLLQQPVELAASGRTDAGVHAKMQVCSFRAESARSSEELLRELRNHLPEDIGAISLEEAPPRFHARLSCRGKRYVYRIWNSEQPLVFDRRYMLRVPEKLDLEAMRKAADALCGKHDFASFCSLKPGKKSTVRELREIRVTEGGDELRLSFTGDGFLYNMVRILTGTLLEVGLGKRQPSEMSAILQSCDRTKAGPTAPAQGLFLWEVYY
jgi:tRNA pseudouridine38-40 synthase